MESDADVFYSPVLRERPVLPPLHHHHHLLLLFHSLFQGRWDWDWDSGTLVEDWGQILRVERVFLAVLNEEP